MSSIPGNISRVPSFFGTRVALSGINSTSLALLRAQTELSTGRRVNNIGDDPLRASGILALADRLSVNRQQKQNLSLADSTLGQLDSDLQSINSLIDEAKGLAQDQVGILSNASQRAAMVPNVQAMIESLLNYSNSKLNGVYLFGGSTPSSPPVRATSGGYQYVAEGAGLLPDIGLNNSVPITLGGGSALGETSSRQRSTTNLAPTLTPGTQISDLRGARGLGVTVGQLSFSFNGGPTATVDLAGSASAADIDARLTRAIRQYETDNSVTILGPGEVGLNGQSLNIDVAGGTLTFADIGQGTTAADLGLSQAAFTPINSAGVATSPRLTMGTPVAALSGVTLPLGTIRLRQTGSDGTNTFRDVDLSGAQDVDDIRAAIEATGYGARVRISDDGSGIDIFNDIAGRTLSVEEVAGGTPTATELGIRTFYGGAAISAMNGGRGVGIVGGFADPKLNTDVRFTLGNGQYFDVDLRPQDMATVQTVIDRINAEFAAAVGTQNNTGAPALAAGQFTATLADGPNGFAFTQTVGPGGVKATTLNNSAAAEQLGLLNLTQDVPSGAYIGQDRLGLRVNNIFSALVALRDALASNDPTGITLAGEDLGKAQERLQVANGVVGGYNRRVQDQRQRLEDQDVVDEQIRSSLMDTDYAEAATRLSNLNTQLQATLQTTSLTQGRTLFDFLS